MNWLEDTHGVQFELVRHFLRRMFDGEWSSSPGQWKSAAIGVFSLFLPAGLLLVREGALDPKYAFKYHQLSQQGLRAAAVADEIALLTLLLCVTGLIALLQWQSLFPSGRDYLALASLPVRSRQIFIAKVHFVIAVFRGIDWRDERAAQPDRTRGIWRSVAARFVIRDAGRRPRRWPPASHAFSCSLRFSHCRVCC